MLRLGRGEGETWWDYSVRRARRARELRQSWSIPSTGELLLSRFWNWGGHVARTRCALVRGAVEWRDAAWRVRLSSVQIRDPRNNRMRGGTFCDWEGHFVSAVGANWRLVAQDRAAWQRAGEQWQARMKANVLSAPTPRQSPSLEFLSRL